MPNATVPKNIAALIERESALQAASDRWSVDAFRAERDRLEAVIRSGAATDAEIEAHARSRDGGETDRYFQGMAASCNQALDAFRRANWIAFREFLSTRLAARRGREEAITADFQALRDGHGIEVEYRDPEASTTSQLATLCESEEAGWIRFKEAAETF
jgi:hypothetical protein